jgi:hypothetical protein
MESHTLIPKMRTGMSHRKNTPVAFELSPSAQKCCVTESKHMRAQE